MSLKRRVVKNKCIEWVLSDEKPAPTETSKQFKVRVNRLANKYRKNTLRKMRP